MTFSVSSVIKNKHVTVQVLTNQNIHNVSIMKEALL